MKIIKFVIRFIMTVLLTIPLAFMMVGVVPGLLIVWRIDEKIGRESFYYLLSGLKKFYL